MKPEDLKIGGYYYFEDNEGLSGKTEWCVLRYKEQLPPTSDEPWYDYLFDLLATNGYESNTPASFNSLGVKNMCPISEEDFPLYLHGRYTSPEFVRIVKEYGSLL